MKPVIACDLPGRLRVRFGGGVFTSGQAFSLEKELTSRDCIRSCFANYINGSVLVEYDGTKKQALREILSIDFRDLEEGSAPDGDRREINRTFTSSVLKRLAIRWIGKAFFPQPVFRAVTLIRSLPYFREGLAQLRDRKLGIPVLDATSIGVAMAGQEFGTASNIMFFLGLSDDLEKYTTQRVQMDLVRSLSLKIDRVWKVNEDGSEEQVPFKELKEGDRVRVRTGHVIPVDGMIVGGEGQVDEASMTGESRLVEKRTGTLCYAGTVLADGDLIVEVREVGQSTRRNRIIDEIDKAGAGKSEKATKAEEIATKLVPYHFLGAALVYALTRNPQKAMATLLVDYSCAIRLCTPVATLAAIREAADASIAVKGGKHLEHLSDAKVFLFDKTGTLTNAAPSLVDVVAFGDRDPDELLRTAACIEEHFPHSVARAIVEAAKKKNLAHEELHGEVEYVVAHGIRSSLNGESIAIGSAHFLFDDEGITIPEEAKKKLEEIGSKYSLLYLAEGDELIGVFMIDDPPRDNAKGALKALRERGVEEIFMVTGDGREMAERIAEEVGIDHVEAQVLPDEKSAIVKRIQEEHGPVVMVGDGINDSPALARAEVSVAMKDASDIAREVSDIVLLRSDLDDLARLRDLADAMDKRIRRNLGMILGFNSALLVGGIAGVLAPTTTAFLHNASTFAFAAESARPYNVLEPTEE